MGKKRKTRQQKIIAELRQKLTLRQAQDETLRQAPTFTSSTPLRVSAGKQDETLRQPLSVEKEAFPTSQRMGEVLKIPTQVERKSVTTYPFGNYSYLTGDLKRVGILTGLAILSQLVLYLALR